MRNPDSGGIPPKGGASLDIFAPDGTDAAAGGREFARASAAVPPDGPAIGDPPRQKTRKRRKRKRGRKVFVRDPGTPANAVGDARVAAEARAALPPSLPASYIAAAPIRESTPVAAVEPAPPSARAFPRRAQAPDLPVYAALDLGTNNCRLLVAIPTRHGEFRVIDAFSRIVRLGEGLTASGRLGDAAMDRAVEALAVCAEKLANRKIRLARLIATEACRAADNGADFLSRVERETGLALEVIDRETEARLAVSGCGSLIEAGTQGVVLFDIGGGSSEIALIDLSRAHTPRLADHIVSWTSLPVGVVSLAERFGGRHVTPDVFDAMVADVAGMLENFAGRDRLAHLLDDDRFHLLGTSGTVTTLAGVFLGLERYDRRRVDGLWMDRGDVDRMTEKLLGWDFAARVANPCIGADRADLVLAGCAILEAIRRVWPSQRLRVADRGLREGILTELMASDGAWRRGRRWGEK